MRLISCYIEGYGKIKRREYTFERGVTTILGENGEGKTTLASFLKAMFYGLKPYRKGSTEFCDREHFYPFDGGLFGGNLTFELNGKICKIERFFGEKSETSDSLKFYENGEEIPSVDDLGRGIFGVDRESFERTTFLDGKEGDIKSTSGIHARLNSFLEGGVEESDTDEAKKALSEAAKVYKKSRAGNDKVTAETAKIARLNESIDNAEAMKGALEGKYSRLTALQAEIERLNEQIVVAQAQNEKRSQKEHYDSLLEGVQRAKGSLQATLQKYPVGIPSEEETLLVNEYMGRSNALKAKLDGMEISLADKEKLQGLERNFSHGVPTEERLLEIEGRMKELSDLQTESKLLGEHTLSEEERKLERRFSKGIPSKELMAQTQETIQRYQKTKTSYEQAPTWLQTTADKKTSGKKYAILAALSLLCILGGGLLLLYSMLGAVVMAIGGVLLLADGFLYLNAKSTAGQAGAPMENPEKKALENSLRKLEDTIKAELMPYGYYSGNGVAFDFATMQSDLAVYGRKVREENARRQRIEQNEGRMQALSQDLTAFFKEYGLAEDSFVKALSNLRVKINDFSNIKSRLQNTENQREVLLKEQASVHAHVQSYWGKYALSDLSMAAILEDIRTVARLNKEIAEGANRAVAFQKEKGVEVAFATEKIDLAQLQIALTECQNERSKLEREISADETEAEKLEGYQAEKAQAEDLLKAYKQKHRLLSAALEQIECAEGKLLDRYVKPIKEEFLRNAEPIESALGERLIMTKNFELRFERNGMERSEKHLSAGQRSICDLCFRLALIKNMYREQLPFLILDDPFTALDERHMEKVAAVLRAWSQEVQILYFTCHSSRCI